MENITSFLLSYVLIYKYLAIFVITFLGALAIPLPSGTVVATSIAFAVQGYLNLPFIFITAVLGNVAGDNFGYWISRRYGVRALHFFGMKKVVGSKKYQKIHAAVNDHPIVLIYFSRFLTSIAPAVNVISGTTRLSYKKYLTFEVLGECTEVAFFSGAGYIFGTNWEYLNKFSWEFWAMFLFAIIFVYLSGRFVFKRRAVQS